MKLKSIMVVAGEISGDIHAAKLLKAVKRKQPDILFFGIGGSELRKLGMEILYDTKDMAVLGFTEVLRKYFFFRTVFRHMLAVAKERKPDAVLLVDYPGFNMRFATYVHALGLKIIYYICPQVWAWHRSRIFKMAQTVDRLITIFPFEKDFFRNTSLPVDFVGHPLIAKTSELLAAPEINLPWTGSPHVALLPGSRYQEVKRILPVMCNAAYFVQQKFPAASFIVAVPSDEIRAYAQTVLAHTEAGKVDLQVITDETLHVLRQAHAAIVASGTATLEAALMRCPVVITYKVSFPTYLLGRMLVKVPYLGIVNLVAGRLLCPEFIQRKATAANIAAALIPLLKEGSERESMLRGFEQVRESLSGGEGDEMAADIILKVLKT